MDLDESTVRALRLQAKRQLRARIRALRQAIPASARAQRSRRIVERLVLLPEFERASSIATFWPMEELGEVDLRALDAAARQAGKRVYYPFIGDGDVGLHEVIDVGSLRERGHGFVEPDNVGRAAVSGDVDLMLVPAIAVTESGHRLGFGGGFYDRLLPRFSPPATSIVVAFDFQLLVELPVEAHDVACDRVVTDRE